MESDNRIIKWALRFMAQNLTPDGFIQFVPIGGCWPQVILGQRDSRS